MHSKVSNIDLPELSRSSIPANRERHDEIRRRVLRALDRIQRAGASAEIAFNEEVAALCSDFHAHVLAKDQKFQPCAPLALVAQPDLPFWRSKQDKRDAHILALFAGTRLDDYIVSALVDRGTGDIYAALKDKGAFVIRNGKAHRIGKSGGSAANSSAATAEPKLAGTSVDLRINETFNRNYVIPKIHFLELNDHGSLSAHAVRVAMRKSGLLVHVTGSDALELGFAYPLLRETGGDVCTGGGRTIGSGGVLQYGTNAPAALYGYRDRRLFLALRQSL